MAELERLTGYRPVFYSNAYDARALWEKRLSRYPLWVAEYGSSRAPSTGSWRTWEGFQYSDKGRIPGVRGLVDLDRFKDGIYLKHEEKSAKRPIVYRVKAGDTLSHIALRCHTTSARLAKLNRIKNPDRIYPGERLIIKR